MRGDRVTVLTVCMCPGVSGVRVLRIVVGACGYAC